MRTPTPANASPAPASGVPAFTPREWLIRQYVAKACGIVAGYLALTFANKDLDMDTPLRLQVIVLVITWGTLALTPLGGWAFTISAASFLFLLGISASQMFQWVTINENVLALLTNGGSLGFLVAPVWNRLRWSTPPPPPS
ncbi:hypothetical protein [Clavibacter michiganensis]|uniref:hypothetical protein n=1 Tax=Clavibacter michiganensis TaxID=28447 RepID=UPI00345BAA30